MVPKDTICFEVKSLANLIKRRVESSSTLKDANRLTGMHGWVIGFLYENSDKGDIFQRDLEEKFTIRRSTATEILQLMEKNGLIIREPVDYDARLKKLVLTPRAIAIHKSISKEIMEIEEQLSKGLTDEERINFLSTLKKIKKNVE